MILFLYGEDSFRSNQKMRELKNKFLMSDHSGSGLSVFDYEEKNQKQNLVDVLGTPNLLAPKRLVIVKNLLSAGTETEKKEIVGYLERRKEEIREDKDLIIVFWEKDRPKKSDKLQAVLESAAKIQKFEKLNGLKLGQWIARRIKEIDPRCGISRIALEKLILYVGNDIADADREIEKLANYAAGRMIKGEDVELLVKEDLNVNIFNTIDALAENDKKRAAHLLQEHLSKGEDPFYVFSMFIHQFRNLLKVTDLKEQYRSNEFAIAKASGLHPFVVKKSLAQLRNFSSEKLKKIYQKLQDYDIRIKTGKIDIRLALNKFIAEL